MDTDQTADNMGRPPVIDFHAHFLDGDILELAQPHSVLTGFGASPLRKPPDGWPPVFAKMMSAPQQIEDMQTRGVDMHVISASTVISPLGWAAGAQALELNCRLNDSIAGWVARFPDRFVGSLTLPLQEPDLAFRELERAARELGLRVVNVPANVDGVYLGESRFHPLWSSIRELGMTAFVHPDGVKDAWFQKYAMWNSIGQSIEETRFMTSMIYEGVIDRFPGLKIVVAHGGGYMPHYMGRLDRNLTDKPETAMNISRRPSSYLRDFYYDSCVYDPATLAALIARVGADRIVMGSDYPVGDPAPGKLLGLAEELPKGELSMILGGTAAHLLGVG
jgi:aminocarboxymuconate-semialdehyde decarboxylase